MIKEMWLSGIMQVFGKNSCRLRFSLGHLEIPNKPVNPNNSRQPHLLLGTGLMASNPYRRMAIIPQFCRTVKL